VLAATVVALGASVANVVIWLGTSAGDPDRVAIAVAIGVGFLVLGLPVGLLSFWTGSKIGWVLRRRQNDSQEGGNREVNSAR
jgi:hypothetical protein